MLRDRKIKVLKEVIPLRSEFYEIQKLLGSTSPELLPFKIHLEDDEMPEK
jgi:hypothetical protein